MRIPLFRPDQFLSATYPYVRPLFSRAFALIMLALGLIGLLLVARQWDTFLATFVDLLTLEGAVFFGLTLSALKVIHEFGHAYTAKRFGCRVPSMGVALLVLVPVLYTDVNEAWKLTARRQRLAIGLAGISAELCCAAIALCAWALLPNGPARSVAFLVATSTWVATVLLNLSPFMRFDGYYVLSDWIETPNLHTRAFAQARWWLRKVLLGLDDTPPEDLPAGRRRFLIAFAIGTWIYRFVLFMGIALLIYHFTFKLVGIAMAAVEIGYFIVWPVAHELREWWKRRTDLRWNAATMRTALVLIVLLALFLVPWRSAVEAPALLKSQQHVQVFMPDVGAKVAGLSVKEGDRVERGAVLVDLTSPDLDYRLARARSELEILEWQIGFRGVDAQLLARSQVTEQEYGAALAEYRGLLDQKERLRIAAPIAGRMVDLDRGLEPGAWLRAKMRLLSIVEPAGTIVEAYLDEADLRRVAAGQSGSFFAEADSRIEVPLRVTEVARASTRVLVEPVLASVNGGPINVRQTKQNELIPDQTLFRAMLAPSGDADPPTRILRGHVVIRGEPQSLAVRIWRKALAVLVRESGA
jgi:putative peptide zinc metalloprotease protein